MSDINIKGVFVFVMILSIFGATVGALYHGDIRYNAGVEEGFVKGEEIGSKAGYEDGYDDGHGDGYNTGNEFGYIFGNVSGFKIGYDVGYINGTTDGYEMGYASGIIEGVGEGYNLRNPTLRELQKFINNDRTDSKDFGTDSCFKYTATLMRHAFEEGFFVSFVYVRFTGDYGHALVSFDTVDHGIQYIEPQNDIFTRLVVGEVYEPFDNIWVTNMVYDFENQEFYPEYTIMEFWRVP